MIPNSKKIIKNIGLVKKNLSKPNPIRIPAIIEETKSIDIFNPIE
tara:strand:+ start:1708 stop:1842 length:135 start_codon:yes stop_codon:yes gene_type:complete